MTAAFDGTQGRETSDTTYEWDCGCIAHLFEHEMNVRACCLEHDEPLDDYVTEVTTMLNPNVEIERIYPK